MPRDVSHSSPHRSGYSYPASSSPSPSPSSSPSPTPPQPPNTSWSATSRLYHSGYRLSKMRIVQALLVFLPICITLYTRAVLAASSNASPSLNISPLPASTGSDTDVPSQVTPLPASSTPTDGTTTVATTTTTTSTSSADEPTSTLDPGTFADIQLMTQRRLSFIVAGANGAANVAQWLSTLGADGKWPDTEVDYTTGCDARRANWPAQDHWNRLLTMSAAWHGGLEGAEQFVKDPTLLDAISRAMDFWFDNDFTNPSCLDSGGTTSCPCGTPGLWNTNWFSNIILIPNLVSQSCLLVNDNLTTTQVSNCTHITGRTYGTFGHSVNGLGIATGANLLDIAKIGIDQGLLNLNASIITDAYSRIHNEVVVENAPLADGIRPDGSFGQHAGIIYNGNYGKDFTNDVLFLEIVAGGTQFAAGDATKDAFATLIAGDLWMIYRNVVTGILHWDFSVLGRFISFPVVDNQATGSIKINITQIEELGEVWDSDILTSAYNTLSTNTTNANVGSVDGTKVFFDNDYMVSRGPGYVTTLRMYSTRTQNTECTNAQNPLGFHLSDGTVYTYMQGTEYEDIAVAWDWNLIPGITVDYGATALTCDKTRFKGRSPFVGGVTDGTLGIGAMNYINPVSRTFSFQKAWFFLDNGAQHIMVSAVNSSSTTAPVFSVLDQKALNGPILVNGLPAFGQTNFTNPKSLWHDQVGYVFDSSPSPSSPIQLALESGPKTGDWSTIGISTVGVATVDLFAAWIDHGINTTFTPISYTAFPAVSPAKFVEKQLTTKLRNIQNDVHISAVFDEIHRVAMIVFWDAAGGSVSFTPSPRDASITVSANGNCAVIFKLNDGSVTVSDPSQTLASLQLTFTVGRSGGKPSGWGNSLSKQLTFALPSGGVAGSSVTQHI